MKHIEQKSASSKRLNKIFGYRKFSVDSMKKMVYNSFVDFAVSLLIAYERRIIMTYALQSTAWLWQKMVQRVVMSPSLTLSLFSSPVENDIVNCMSNKRIENRINEPESSDFYSEILFNLRLGFVCCVCIYA